MKISKHNRSAAELWEQLFATLAKEEGAALADPQHDVAADDARMRLGLARAGWSEAEIDLRIEQQKARRVNASSSSPGVAPHVEPYMNMLCDDIEAAMVRLRLDSHARIARGIEPRTGPYAAKTNVIMTDQSIVTVGSFLFRFCGLVARAFTRTLHLNPHLWERPGFSQAAGRTLLRAAPEVTSYWLHIFVSYAITGTHIMAPYRPAAEHELVLFEQVARAMEIFAIAHEYGHHHHDHGRRLEDDPKREEFEADQFALKISYEVETKPLLVWNPYLSSGAGGLVLLLALGILRKCSEVITGVDAEPSDTHPTIPERLARFDTVAVLKPTEFAVLKSFRTVSTRIMTCVDSELSLMIKSLEPSLRDQLRTLALTCR